MPATPHVEVSWKLMKGITNKTVDESCVPCTYFCFNTRTCDYYLTTKQRRNSPAGEGCNKFTPRAGERKMFGTSLWYEPSMSEKMRACYDEGLTDQQIGRRLGVSAYYVSNWRQWNKLPSQYELRKGAERDWI